MAPVHFDSPTTYSAPSNIATSSGSPVAYDDSPSPSSTGTGKVVFTTTTTDDPSSHWRGLHVWLPIGLLMLLAFAFMLWAMLMHHRLRKARRQLRAAEEQIEEMRAGSGSGSGPASTNPAVISEKMSGAPVVMVTPASNGSGQEVVVTTTPSGAPGSTPAGANPAVIVSDANGGQTVVAPVSTGNGSAVTDASVSTPSGGAAGSSTIDPTQAPSTATAYQTADPRASGTASTVVEQPQTVVDRPGLVVQEAPRV